MNRLADREINYLGALLHDIGKLIWRSKDIMIGETHESLGERFIREELSNIECLKSDIDEIIKAAKRQRGKIWKADVVAAEEREDSLDKTPRRYLEAITNRVDFNRPKVKTKSENYWYYLPKPLDIGKENNFPINSGKELKNYSHNETEYQEYHRVLYENFKDELKQLEKEDDFKTFSRTFIKLLEKYTSKVLSAGYLSHPDISLYDHSRVTAALSVCYEDGDPSNECLLIKGDLSGIQSYIYGGISEMTDIAKRLRGRSFTIQLLADVISNYFLEELDLFEANLIYNCGGHFLILAPCNDNIKTRLENISSKINHYLLERYSGRISLIWDYVECSGEKFINDFRDVYEQLDEKLNNNKKLKFRKSLKELFSLELKANEFRNKEKEIERVEKEIGELLPKLKYFVISKFVIKPKNPKNSFLVNFPEYDTTVYLCKDEASVEELISLADTIKGLRIISINDTNVISKFSRNIFLNVSKEFRFLGNNVPIEDNRILSVDDLAEIHSKNYPLLGIMRLDVDNLGAIFSFGLRAINEKEKKYTPSRVANLSRELNWFFTGYINELASKFNIYIAYSGGDDVFIVGNWFDLIKFANGLRQEFHEFVCNNNNLSASAGIIFSKPNFPISQSALLAGEQEKLAKNTEIKLEKDKVGVLDIQLSWKEFDEFISYADKLIEFIESDEGKKIIPRSFLYYLYSITTNIFDKKGKLNIRKLSKATSILHYMFARRKVNASVLKSENKGKQVEKLLYELAVRLLLSKDKESEYKKIKFPLTLVLYKTRR
jgi:CRISPR-associated protein Csm1